MVEPTLEQIAEAQKILDSMVRNAFPDHDVKAQAIRLYNVVYQHNHNVGTNCSSCLKSVRLGLIKLANHNKV